MMMPYDSNCKNTGNLVNPKILYVFPFPNINQSDSGKAVPDNEPLIKHLIGNSLDENGIAFIVNDVRWTDFVTKTGVASPNADDVLAGMEKFKKLVKSLPNDTIIMPLGTKALEYLKLPQKIGYSFGLQLTSPIGTRNKFIPNYHPDSMKPNRKIISLFKRINSNAMEGKPLYPSLDPEHRVLNFKEALFEFKKVIKMYQEGKIGYIVFDLETSSFDPVDGRIIMPSWCYEGAPCGFSFPFEVVNEIHLNKKNFAKKYKKDEFQRRMEAQCEKYGIPIIIKNQLKEQKKDYKMMEESTINDLWVEYSPQLKTDLEVTKEQAEAFVKLLRYALEVVQIPIVGHNLKFDAKFLDGQSICDIHKLKIKDDTMILGFQVLNRTFGVRLGLEPLAERYMGISWKDEVKDYLNGLPEDQRSYAMLPTAILGVYAARDGYWNMRLYDVLKALVPDECNLITSVNTALINTVSGLELNGLKVDTVFMNQLIDFLKAQSEGYLKDMEDLPRMGVHIRKKINESIIKLGKIKSKKMSYKEIRDNTFKLGSGPQLREILFRDKSLYLLPQYRGKKFSNKTGQKVDAKVVNFFINDLIDRESLDKMKDDLSKAEFEELDRYAEAREFLILLLKWRRNEKLLTTYLNPVKENLKPSGIFSYDYNMTGTKSGRYSAGFHTIDTSSDVMRMYISRWKDEGGLFVAMDYSQIELRVAASVSGEVELINAYKNGVDLHYLTASKALSKPISEVTKKERNKVGKTLNFFLLYGGTEKGLANMLEISVEEARSMIANFKLSYPKLIKYLNGQLAMAKDVGFIKTAWGRRIPVEDIHNENDYIKANAENFAINTGIQSAASDIVITSMHYIDYDIMSQGLKSLLIGTIHDSIEADCYPTELFKLIQIFKRNCEERMVSEFDWIKCPLAISVDIGATWKGAIEFEIKEISDEHIVLEGGGLEYDVKKLVSVAELSYQVELEVLATEKVKDGFFSVEHLVTCENTLDIRLTLRRK